MTKTDVRDSATIILIRDTPNGPAILMGQRGSKAAFMPSKFVFPGGAVDRADGLLTDLAIAPTCAKRLQYASECTPEALMACVIRELWEETGQILGQPSQWADAPKGWEDFASTGHKPSAANIKFIFRAKTPKGQARRFDARFFLANADELVSNLDNFEPAEQELSNLQWVPLKQIHEFDLPFITKVALKIVNQHLDGTASQTDVPYFQMDREGPDMGWLSEL